MSLFRAVRRMATAALVMTAAAVSVAAPAVAQPTIGPVLPGSWEASYAGATAVGTQTVLQHPLGVSQSRTVKGLIRTGSASGCFHVSIRYGTQTWESPVTCAGATPQSFSTTFQTLLTVRPPATVQLCAGKECGAPTTLW